MGLFQCPIVNDGKNFSQYVIKSLHFKYTAEVLPSFRTIFKYWVAELNGAVKTESLICFHIVFDVVL